MWIADPFTDSGIGQVVIACGSAVGAGLVLFKPLRSLWRFGKGLAQFVNDWHGEPDRPGVKGRTGMMEWRQQVDEHMAEVRAELKTNGGSSMRDDVIGIRHAVDEVKTMAGEAATAASIAQEVGRHNEEMLEQQSAELLRHVEESHTREMGYVAIFHELGLDIEIPRADGTD